MGRPRETQSCFNQICAAINSINTLSVLPALKQLEFLLGPEIFYNNMERTRTRKHGDMKEKRQKCGINVDSLQNYYEVVP